VLSVHQPNRRRFSLVVSRKRNTICTNSVADISKKENTTKRVQYSNIVLCGTRAGYINSIETRRISDDLFMRLKG